MPARAPSRFPFARTLAAGALAVAAPFALAGLARAQDPPASPPAPAGVSPPAASETTPTETASPAVNELDARIERLEKEMAADEAVLADYLTDADAARRLREAGEIDAIAERLPRRQEELRALRARRAGGGSDAP